MLFEGLKKNDVTQKALPFFKEYLGYGKTFSQLFLKGHSLNLGEIFSYFPHDIDLSGISNFRHSVLFSQHTKTSSYQSEDVLVAIIKQFLARGKNNICIFEDSNAKPTDPYFLNLKLDIPWLGHADEVYYILNNDMNAKEKIFQVIRHASSWLTIGALVSLRSEIKFSFAQKKITNNQLKLLARDTTSIILGAYDGEGYLIWEKAKSTLNFAQNAE